MRQNKSLEALFIVGFALIVGGLCLLLVTTGILKQLEFLWPFALLLAGGLMLFFGFTRKIFVWVVFAGSESVLCGGVALIARFLSIGIEAWWPLIVIATGLSILPAGFRRYGKVRGGFLAPAILFIILGIVFSLFSFGAINTTFREFIDSAWPVVLIAVGFGLVFLYAYNRYRFRKDSGVR